MTLMSPCIVDSAGDVSMCTSLGIKASAKCPKCKCCSSSSCSYHVERKSCRGKTPVNRRGVSSSSSDLFIVGVAMIAEKLRLAHQGEGGGRGEGLGRYVAAYFDYSSENDVPTLLSLAPR